VCIDLGMYVCMNVCAVYTDGSKSLLCGFIDVCVYAQYIFMDPGLVCEYLLMYVCTRSK
jgi:hypothetical protein